MKKYLLFGVIASVLSINAYAVSATVTSKDYVDTTRQATIPASGTNASTPGDTVVTYTSTAGTIGERGICDAETYYDGNCGYTNLVTTDVIGSVLDYVDEALIGLPGTVPIYDGNGYLGDESRGIYDGSNGYNSSTDADKLVTAAALQSATNLPEKTVTYKTCVGWSGTPHTDANCLLWNLSNTDVYGAEHCRRNSDCVLGCSSGYGECNNGICDYSNGCMVS